MRSTLETGGNSIKTWIAVALGIAALCLAACDPVAQKSITVKLNEQPEARKTVLAVIETNLVAAGLKQSASGSGEFHGAVIDARGQKSGVSILVSYDAPSREIRLSMMQAFRFRITPKLAAVIETAKREACATGYVQAIELK